MESFAPSSSSSSSSSSSFLHALCDPAVRKRILLRGTLLKESPDELSHEGLALESNDLQLATGALRVALIERDIAVSSTLSIATR